MLQRVKEVKTKLLKTINLDDIDLNEAKTFLENEEFVVGIRKASHDPHEQIEKMIKTGLVEIKEDFF